MRFRGSLKIIIYTSLIVGCSLTDVSIESQPSNRLSSIRLALTVARMASCGNFEYTDFQKSYSVFECQMEGDNPLSFTIWTFYDQATKNKIITNNFSSGETKWGREFPAFKTGPLYKAGAFYLISESGRFTNGGGLPENAIEQTAQDYANFPGEIVMPLQTNKKSVELKHN